MAPVKTAAVRSLRCENEKVTEHMRRKEARVVKQRNRMVDVNPADFDSLVATALTSLASSAPLPRVKTAGVEYIEPDFRTAKQKRRAKKDAKKATKRAALEAKVVQPKPVVLDKDVVKPKAVKPEVQVKEQEVVDLSKTATVKSTPPAEDNSVDHNRLNVFTDRMKSGDMTGARAFLRTCFGMDCENNTPDEQLLAEAYYLNYLHTYAIAIRKDADVIESTPYGSVEPRFVGYKSRMTNAMWKFHNGPVVTQWEGKPYTVSEKYSEWDLNEDGVPGFAYRAKRVFTKPTHKGFIKAAEKFTPIGVCGIGMEERDLAPAQRGRNWSLQTMKMSYPVMIGDVQVGTEVAVINCLVPRKCLNDKELRDGRVAHSETSRNRVAARTATPIVKIELATPSDNKVVSITDFVERQATLAEEYTGDTSVPAANDVPDSTKHCHPPAEGQRWLGKEEPDAIVVAPAHLQATKHRTEPHVDPDHQRMLAFRENTLTRLLPRYLVHKTEAAPVTMQIVVQCLPDIPMVKDVNRNALTLLGNFVAPECTTPVAIKPPKDARDGTLASKRAHYALHGRTIPVSNARLNAENKELKEGRARIIAASKWRHGRETRALWEMDKRAQLDYTGDVSRLVLRHSPKRHMLLLPDTPLSYASRKQRMYILKLANKHAARRPYAELAIVSHMDDQAYSVWSSMQNRHPLISEWLERAAWKEAHPEVTMIDYVHLRIKNEVAGHRHVFETFPYKVRLEKRCTSESQIVLPAAGLELTGQGTPLVIDTAGIEMVADKPLIVIEPERNQVTEENILSQIMSVMPGAMTEAQQAVSEAIEAGVPASEVRRLVSQYTQVTTGGILYA